MKLRYLFPILALLAVPAWAQMGGGIYNGGTGGGTANVSITAGSPNIVISPSPLTGTGTVSITNPIDAQGTAASYTILSTDMGKTVTHSKTTAVAVTLPQAGTTGFASGVSYTECNNNTGAVTITPTTSTILGGSTLIIGKGQCAYLYSDGTNWGGVLGNTPYPASGDVVLSAGANVNPTGVAEVDGDCLLGASGVWSAGSCNGSSAFTLTTTGSSGAATYTGGVLNIPQYSGGGSGINPTLLPSSYYTTDTAGNLFPYVYTGSGGNASPSDSGWGVVASLGTDVALQMRFQMPPAIPGSGTFKLVSYCQANATSGVVKYTVSDADVAAGSDPSAASLTSETQTSITWTTASAYVVTKTSLTETPVADDVSVIAVTFNHTSWTLAQILSCRWVELWE